MKKPLLFLILSLLFITIMPIGVYGEELNESNSVAYSENNGKRTYYRNVTDAVNAGMRYDITIVMIKDWDFRSPMNVVEGTTLKIEMNGHFLRRVDLTDRSTPSPEGHVIIMHPNSKLYLYGYMDQNHYFDVYDRHNYYGAGIISGGVVSGGYAEDGGGIYMKKGAQLHIEHVAIAVNNANDGGGIYVDGQDCQIYMDNGATIEENNATGGGIYSNADGTHIHIEGDSAICRNNNQNHFASSGGGVYFNYSWFSIESGDMTGKVSNNEAYRGGGIYVCSKSFGSNHGTIKNLTIEGNLTGKDGAGLYLDQNNTSVENCVIKNNEANYNGGGIYTNGNNIISNTTITGNKCNQGDAIAANHEGGGVYCNWGYDIKLTGSTVIRGNLRMKGNEKHWWSEAAYSYYNGYYGYTDDDVFLGGSSVYIDASNLDCSNSLIGIRTGESNDKKCVKNVNNFKWGKTFFMDLAKTYHIGYETGDKEVWQRIDTSSSTKYSVIINNVEAGRYTYDQEVTVDGGDKDGRFLSWYSSNFDLTDEQKASKKITFKMPSYDVELSTVINYDGAEEATLTVDAPIVGASLSTTGNLKWTIDKVGYGTETPVTWYEDDNGVYKETSGTVKANTNYFVKINVEKDGNENKIFTGLSKDKTRVIYKTIKSEDVDIASKMTVDENGTLSVEGKKITSINGKYNLTYIGDSIKIEVDSTPEELQVMLPKKAQAYNELILNDVEDFGLDVDNAILSEVKLDVVGNYEVTIPVKRVEGKEFITDTIKVPVSVINRQAKISSVDDTEISVDVGLDGKSLIEELKKAFSGNAKAKDTNNNEIDCKVGLSYISNTKLLENFTNNGLLLDSKIVAQDKDYVFTRDVYTMGGSNIEVGDVKAKFIIHVNNKETNSLENEIAVASVEDEEIHQLVKDDYVAMPKVTSNLEAKVYSVSDIGNDFVTYGEKGDLSLKVELGVVDVDNKTPSIKYVLYHEDSNKNLIQDAASDYNSALTLSAKKGEYKTYMIEAWSILDGQVSDVNSFAYTIDNTKSTITVITKYNDSNKQVQEPKVLTFDYGQENVNIDIPIIEKHKMFAWSYTGGSAGTYGDDECLVTADKLGNNETLTVYYYPAITKLSLDIDSLTAGENLPTINNVTAKLSTGETVDVTSYFNLDDIKWYPSDSKTVDYDTIYTAILKVKDNEIFTKYALNNESLVIDANSNCVNHVYETEGDSICEVAFIYSATDKKEHDSKLSYTINSISNITYDEVSYENALKANNQVDAYNIPYKIKVSLTDNNTGKRFDSYLDVNWNKEFTTSFNPNNYDSQELVINGTIEVPNYYTNSDNINKNVTLRIKINSKLGYIPQEVLDNSSNKAVTCEEYMKSKDWTWSESKKACVYKVSNTNSK